MPRRSAGARYPYATTAARVHECALCDVTGAIAERARAGQEPWGTPHALPPIDVTETQARKIRQQLFLGRSCKRLARIHGTLSVSVTYQTADGQLVNDPPVRQPNGYHLVIRVWARDIAKADIARRVENGEPLPYNVMRGNQ